MLKIPFYFRKKDDGSWLHPNLMPMPDIEACVVIAYERDGNIDYYYGETRQSYNLSELTMKLAENAPDFWWL